MQDLLTLIIVGIGFGVMFRLIRLRTALLVILTALLLPALGSTLHAASQQASPGFLSQFFLWIAPFKQLFLILLGMGVIIGLVSPKTALRKTLRIFLMPFVLLIGWYCLVQVWHQLTPLQCFLAIVIAVPATAWYFLVHTAFGREVLASILGNFFYDGLRRHAGCFPWLLLALIIIGLILNAMTLSSAQGCFLRKARHMIRVVVCVIVPERTDDAQQPVDKVVGHQLRGLALGQFLLLIGPQLRIMRPRRTGAQREYLPHLRLTMSARTSRRILARARTLSVRGKTKTRSNLAGLQTILSVEEHHEEQTGYRTKARQRFDDLIATQDLFVRA